MNDECGEFRTYQLINFLTQILQLAAKSARRADESPFGGFVWVNPDQNATHFASAEGKFCYCKIWV
jgi:hypothetical protein